MPSVNLMKPVTEFAGSALKMVEKDPAALARALAMAIPAVAAMSLINLEPVGDTVGEYLKNKLVPGLDYANRKREVELEALQEMGAKQLPMLEKERMLSDQSRQMRRDRVAEAMSMKPELVREILQDSFLEGADAARVDRLVEDLIKIAPIAISENPAVAKSAVRAAILGGSDSIDPSTAIQLASLEETVTGA